MSQALTQSSCETVGSLERCSGEAGHAINDSLDAGRGTCHTELKFDDDGVAAQGAKKLAVCTLLGKAKCGAPRNLQAWWSKPVHIHKEAARTGGNRTWEEADAREGFATLKPQQQFKSETRS